MLTLINTIGWTLVGMFAFVLTALICCDRWYLTSRLEAIVFRTALWLGAVWFLLVILHEVFA